MTDPLLRELVKGFAQEARDLTEKVTRDLLVLERDGERDVLAKAYDNLARGLHTLKGTASTVGLEDCSELAHHMEDLCAPLRSALRPLPAEAADALLKSLDALLRQVEAHAEGSSDKVKDLTPYAKKLEKVLKGVSRRAADKKAANGEAVEAPAAVEADVEAAQEEVGSWRVNTRQVIELIRDVERLREVSLRLEERHRDLEKGINQLAKLGMLAETAEARALMMLASRAVASDGEEVSDVVNTMEDGLKAICTLPVRTILEPLHRAVRDLCRNSGKEARLSVVGAEVSLDRRVLEALKGPMVHLIRNAVDHGVEPPAERERRGKHREAALTIRVEQLGNVLFIEVSDDGAGLDLGRIREVAIQRGLATEADLRGMQPAQLHDLIFQPGFSTSREVTETSGRGVGLDVVRSQVRSLEGQIEAQSTPGQGARFILSLPADLGSSAVLVIRAGEYSVALPMLSVEMIQAADPAHLRAAGERSHFVYREEILPLEDLGGVLGLRPNAPPELGRPVLILQSHGRRLALAVDEVVGDRDVVIRPLPAEVRELPSYQGAATMARGELMLVLRPDWLIELSQGADRKMAAAMRRALVVDDSLTARALHRAVLEAGGFTVHAASSAAQALEQLQASSYDVMVADVSMDDMDGLALTAAIRSKAATRQLPVVLVSSLDTDADRQRGIESGADGFLSKKDCSHGRLLAEVNAVLSRRREA